MTSILVIEDDSVLRKLIVDALESKGYEVSDTGDGHDGIRIACHLVPDLVVCDINMPGIDGYQVLAALREDPNTNTIPFIFLTARAGRLEQRKGMDLGADDYITKPFTPDELFSAINTRLRRQHQQEERLETTLSTLRHNIIYALPHELRTPLSLILGYAEVLEMDSETLERPEIHKMAGRIVRAGRRLERFIENYLVYAQIELLAGDPDHREQVRNHVVAAPGAIIEEQARRQASRHLRDADLLVDVCDRGVQVSGENLRKIVEELTDNAFKFSKPGTPVSVTSTLLGGNYVVAVQDFGRGMTAEHIANMGAYMQFERTLHEQQGLGLGFTIARRLAELHDATVSVQSILDEGTLVEVAFVT